MMGAPLGGHAPIGDAQHGEELQLFRLQAQPTDMLAAKTAKVVYRTIVFMVSSFNGGKESVVDRP